MMGLWIAAALAMGAQDASASVAGAPPSGDPCPAMARIEAAARAPRPFIPLRAASARPGGAGAGLAALPGVDPCRIVLTPEVALVCLTPMPGTNAAQAEPDAASQLAALEAHATRLGRCLPALYALSRHEGAGVGSISYGAGRLAPYFQFSVVSDLREAGYPQKLEMLVMAPAPAMQPAQAPTKAKAPARSRPKAKAAPR